MVSILNCLKLIRTTTNLIPETRCTGCTDWWFCRCDRIIWFGKGLKQNQYDRGELKLSDHRPVRAIFMAEIKVLRDPTGLQSFLQTELVACQTNLNNVSMTNIHVNGDQTSIIEHKLQLLCLHHKKIQTNIYQRK